MKNPLFSNTDLLASAGLYSTPAVMDQIPAFLFNKPKPKAIKQEKKCLLKSCNNRTKHNGGYCCKEHKKEDTK